MATILLLNGGKAFGNSGGRLSQTLHNVAKQTLQNLGFKILETHIDEGYDEQTEVQKWLDSKVIIYQMPGWWIGDNLTTNEIRICLHSIFVNPLQVFYGFRVILGYYPCNASVPIHTLNSKLALETDHAGKDDTLLLAESVDTLCVLSMRHFLAHEARL